MLLLRGAGVIFIARRSARRRRMALSVRDNANPGPAEGLPPSLSPSDSLRDHIFASANARPASRLSARLGRNSKAQTRARSAWLRAGATIKRREHPRLPNDHAPPARVSCGDGQTRESGNGPCAGAAVRAHRERTHRIIPSGRQPLVDNRVAWANNALEECRLLGVATARRPPHHGARAAASRRSARADRPQGAAPIPRVSRVPKAAARAPDIDEETDSMRTPEEHIEYGYGMIRKELKAELIQQVKACSPGFLRVLVSNCSVAMGYGVRRCR